jgi:hypothetical protein
MKQLIVPMALIGMGLLLLGAATIDCARIAGDYQRRVATADGELQKHEGRLVKVLDGAPKVTPEVSTALSTYKAASTADERHTAYDGLTKSFQQTMSGAVDATNPLDRKFMDEAAGSINRRQIAEKQYDEEMVAYKGFLQTWRGKLARVFSSQARADAKK